MAAQLLWIHLQFSYNTLLYVLSLLQEGRTALLCAGWNGHSKVVELLLGAGARDIPNKVEDVIDGTPLPLLYV